jgi:uncharacterized protein with HEPN domain
MIDDRDRSLLIDMLSYAKEAVELLGGVSPNELAADKMRRYAVARAVEVVGEAASQVSVSGRQAHPEIPWSAAIRTRNRLIHAYRGLDEGIMASTVREDFPPLIEVL